ncbi:MAG: iron-containing alcohol dehydrogenase [Syntrophomonadaceae bacterium]|nr:iron-containing alcohol dehydrogenase [Syntrophomonadaceae bacterium]
MGSIPKYFAWDFHTLVEVGSGSRTLVPQRFMEMGAKRVGLITDKGLCEAGIIEQITDIFAAQGAPKIVGIYDRVEQDAAMRVINDCAAWCRVNAVDGLLGVGGGSVLDTVKGVKALLGMGEVDIKQLMPANIGPYIRPLGQPLGIPNVSIPTTAGTGSEVSPIAVIYNEEAQVKGDFLHPFIPADIAILDPDLTVGLPPAMTAYTGFDALTHAVEGLASPGANPMIDALSLQAIRLICKYLPIAVQDGKNLEARTNMLIASNIAIMSFAMSGLFYPIHNVAHAAGGQLRIPHGQACAVAMPHMIRRGGWHFDRRAIDLAGAFGIHAGKMSAQEAREAVSDAILQLMDSCGVKARYDYALDAEGRTNMFFAVRFDPSGILYPIPDEVLNAVLEDCYPT